MSFNKFLLLSLLLFRFIFAYEEQNLPQSPPTPSDELQFGKLWRHIQHLQEEGLLIGMIQERREEIASIKDHWKQKLKFSESKPFFEEMENLLEVGKLEQTPSGSGGAYILSNQGGDPAFVLKPFDEDMLCLHNSKALASPFNDPIFRVRRSIPLYRSMQAEALAYCFAQKLQLTHLTPETHIGIITHPQFFDISDHLDEGDNSLGAPVREKLCSVQKYERHMGNLHSLVKYWIRTGTTERQICEQINKEEFENLFLLIWLLYDTDAHAGNIYVTEDSLGTLTLVKFDNGLTFPEKNESLLNALYFFPQAKFPPSKRLSELIQTLPIESLVETIQEYEMENCVEAFLERVAVLQSLTRESARSLREIDLRMRSLELPGGPEAALAEVSMEELERLISY